MKIKTSFEFDAAHRLTGYDGNCSNLHGHLWHVDIKITGNDEDINEVGILWDFNNVKKLKELFDHKTLILDCEENRELINILIKTCGITSVILLKKNPTAEFLTLYILEKLKKINNKFDYVVRVYESPKSYVEIED